MIRKGLVRQKLLSGIEPSPIDADKFKALVPDLLIVDGDGALIDVDPGPDGGIGVALIGQDPSLVLGKVLGGKAVPGRVLHGIEAVGPVVVDDDLVGVELPDHLQGICSPLERSLHLQEQILPALPSGSFHVPVRILAAHQGQIQDASQGKEGDQTHDNDIDQIKRV